MSIGPRRREPFLLVFILEYLGSGCQWNRTNRGPKYTDIMRDTIKSMPTLLKMTFANGYSLEKARRNGMTSTANTAAENIVLRISLDSFPSKSILRDKNETTTPPTRIIANAAANSDANIVKKLLPHISLHVNENAIGFMDDGYNVAWFYRLDHYSLISE